MADVLERYQELKKKKDELEKKKIELSVRLEQMRKDYKEIISSLKSDFNVSSLDEAKDLKDKMEKELNDKCVELKLKLDRFDEAAKSVDGGSSSISSSK